MSDVPSQRNPGSRWRGLLDLVATMSMLVVAGVLAWGALGQRDRTPRVPLPRNPLPIADAEIAGDPAARVAIVEFSDFECPFCAGFTRDIWPTLKARYIDSGKAVLAFRHFPLPPHPGAYRKAQAAECAGRQGRFWAMHDVLFADPRSSGEHFEKQVADLGLNGNEFERCISGESKAKVDSDLASAKSLSINGTPMFFMGIRDVNGNVRVSDGLFGSKSADEFSKIMDKLVKKAAD